MQSTQSGKNYKLSLTTLSYHAWLFPGLVVVGIGLMSVLVIRPQLDQISQEQRLIENRSNELLKLEEKRRFLETANETTLAEQLAIMQAALPNQKPVYEILSSIQGLTNQFDDVNVTGYELTPGKISSASADDKSSEKPGELTELAMEISFRSSLPQLLNLVANLENMAPLVDVSGFALTGELSNQEALVNDQKNIGMTLRMYYALPPETIGRVTDSLKPLDSDDLNTISQAASLTEYRGFDQIHNSMSEGTNPNLFIY